MKKRRIFIFIYIISAVSVCFSFTSCSAGDGVYEGLMSFLGFDMNDYEGEDVVREVGSDDAVYGEIQKIIEILMLDSTHLEPFDSPRDAAAGNRDAILNHMLNTGYAGYSGNSELLAEASSEYPQYNITTLIPESDLESTVYRFFGGDSSVKHESSVRYTYLSRVAAYTTTGQPLAVTVELKITSLSETEHTYRVSFTLKGEDGGSESYNAMIMKREDETMYMRYLRAES